MMHDSNMTPAAASVTILAHYREAAIAKLEKVARKAAKYGQEITWTERPFAETVRRVRWDGEKVDVTVHRIEFLIVGTAPRVGDFKFLAALENVPGGVLVSSVPGLDRDIGDLGFNWRGNCEHCGSNRSRVYGYVVEGPDGSRKVVGKSCLRDYLGTDVPAGLLNAFRFQDLADMGGDEELGGWGGYGRWQESTVGVIATARAAIALWGWRPSSHEGMTTAVYVNLVYGPRETDGKGREINKEERVALETELRERGDHYQREADAVLAWGRALEGRSDYERNLKVALAGDVVIGKTFNLVVSACAAFDRQVAREDEARQRREAEEARKAALPPSRHVGNPGERLTAIVTVERVIGLPDRGYGPSTIYALRADDGPVLSWKTSSHAPRINGKPLQVGDRASVTFTVKEHVEFRDTPETRVLRAKFEAAPAAAPLV